MAGNIIATIPTSHTAKNEEIILASGELKMSAIVEIGMTVAEDLVAMDEEV
jgi:hypothetical protein